MTAIKCCIYACSAIVLYLHLELCAEDLTDFSALKNFLQRNCIECHGLHSRKGGVRLDQFEHKIQVHEMELWREVLSVLRNGEMPPKDQPQPDRKEVMRWCEWLERQLEQISRFAGSEGLRRMNRKEFSYTVNSLFDLADIDWSQFLPDDGNDEGFDKFASTLSYSPEQIVRYLQTARLIVKTTFKDKPNRSFVLYPTDLLGNDSLNYRKGQVNLHKRGADTLIAKHWGAPIDESVGALAILPLIPYNQPYSRKQESNSRLPGVGFTPQGLDPDSIMHLRIVVSSRSYEDRGTPRLRVLLNCTRLAEWEVTAVGSERQTFDLYIHVPDDIRSREKKEIGFRVEIENGYELRDVAGKAYTKELQKQNPNIRDLLYPREFLSIIRPPLIYLHEIQINPLQEKHFQSSEHPFAPNAVVLASRESITAGLKAYLAKCYRGLFAENDVAQYLKIFDYYQQAGYSHRSAYMECLATGLIDPRFWHLRGPALQDTPAERAISVANRLAYFLWSEPPDTELLQAARNGKLNDPESVRKHAQRMLVAPQASRMSEDFCDSWLHLRELSLLPSNDYKFSYGHYLRDSMRLEPIRYFEYLLKNNLSATLLIESDIVMSNDIMAEHYSLPPQRGEGFKKIDLKADSPRGGLLTTAAVLTLTGVTEATPTYRGAWILRNIIHRPPPPPPLEVPELSKQKRGTLRERLLQHSQDVNCMSCHERIDPLGFALQVFDSVGRYHNPEQKFNADTEAYKNADRGQKRRMEPPRRLDTTGKFPDGVKFDDVFTLKKMLIEKYPEEFVKGLACILLSYALGRKLNFEDRQEVDLIVNNLKAQNYPLQTLVLQLVSSRSFCER